MYLLTANQARSIYNLNKYIIKFRKSALRVLRRAVFYFENTQQFVLLPAWRSVLENLNKASPQSAESAPVFNYSIDYVYKLC